jgi:hypothetical protein
MSKQPWSISSLTKYETCPRQYHEMNVLKNFQDKPSEAMAWGDEVHKSFDKYFSKDAPLPIGMRQFKPLLDVFKNQPGEKLVEQKLALSEVFSPTTWFGKNVWVRSIVDLAVVNPPKAIIIDWKTGKIKEDYDQLALMTAVMFNQAEELEEITAMFVWTQEWDPDSPLKCISKVTYNREELPMLWDRFMKREEAFQDAHDNTDFPPKPSGLCTRFCPVSTCPYHGA